MIKSLKDNELYFGDAEIGDSFYQVSYLPYGEGVFACIQYTVSKIGKRDIVCTPLNDSIMEMRFNKSKTLHHAYQRKEDVLWAFEAIKLRKKRTVAGNVIKKYGFNRMPESLLDQIIALGNTLEHQDKEKT